MSGSGILTDKKRSLIFINLIISCIATSLLQTALTTALPAVVSEFQISTNTGQWLTSAYSLVMAIMMPLTAFFIRRFPTKYLYVTAIAIFMTGLGICCMAPTFPIMMCGRVLQACSNGILSSMAQVVLLSIYPAEKTGTIMGWYGLSVGAAPVIAPTLAGILVDSLGWRMIFILSLCIMFCSFIWAIMVMENVLETERKKFDVLSFFFSALTFGGLTLGLGNISSGFSKLNTWLPLLIGITGSCVFIYRQLHLSQPFLELRIFRTRNFRLSVLGSMMLYLIMMGSSILMPLYIQNIMGFSATISGLVILPGSLVMAFISPLAGRIYDKMGMRRLAIIGSVALSLGLAGMGFIDKSTPLAVAVLLNLIRNVAIGCLMMPFVTWGISSIDNKNMADGTALINSLRTIAGAIGTAVFVGIMNYVSLRSAAAYGADADIHGMNISFLAMGAVGILMIVVAVVWIRGKDTD